MYTEGKENMPKYIYNSEVMKISINSNNNEEKIWLLNAGIKIEKETSLNINSNDVTWLRIIPSKNTKDEDITEW